MPIFVPRIPKDHTVHINMINTVPETDKASIPRLYSSVAEPEPPFLKRLRLDLLGKQYRKALFFNQHEDSSIYKDKYDPRKIFFFKLKMNFVRA